MFKSTFATSAMLSLLLFSSAPSAGQNDAEVPHLEPAINGAVSATGRFPTQSMEDAYLVIAWTEGHGLRGAAAMSAIEQQIEPAMNGAVASRGVFPSQAMEDQYQAYLEWTRNNGLGELYAFERIEG